MKTIEQIVKNYKSRALDGRDISRLVKFLAEEQMTDMGMELKDEYKGKHTPIAFTREAVLEALKGDVAFGFEKALNQRGISASLMFTVVRMWNWILEEGLEGFDEDDYAQYGLPLFKATAEKYNFDNPIGEKTGREYKYSSDYDGE